MTESPAEETAPAPAEASRRLRYRELAFGFGALVVVLIALIAAAPFWAPPLLPILPWGGAPEAKLAQRLERLETARDQERQTVVQTNSAVDQLGRHIAALEKAEGEWQQATTKGVSAEQQLESRIGALETAQKQEQRDTDGTASNLKALAGRVAALESKPEPSTKDLGDLRQQLENLSAARADLSGRVDALQKEAQARSAADPTDAALLLDLLQIRDAVQSGRPFAAEYDALAALAHDRPEIAEAAAALAQPSRTGVAGPAVLAKRLHELSGSIASAQAPSAQSGWGSEALARLRGLVTVRRVGGAGQSGPETAVNTAETALAAGDLGGAIAALDKLTGAPAEAARPWLQMARERQSVDSELRRIEALLTARLGKASEANASAGPSR